MQAKLYTSPTCPYCKLVKDLLEENAVDFEQVDVAQDAEGARQMVAISGQMGVPVLDLGEGKVVVGWNRQAIEEFISKKN